MMIILELTSDYQATLVAGISIVFASLISYKVIGQSVFDKVLLNKNYRLELINKGKIHCRKFSWEKTVSETIKILKI